MDDFAWTGRAPSNNQAEEEQSGCPQIWVPKLTGERIVHLVASIAEQVIKQVWISRENWWISKCLHASNRLLRSIERTLRVAVTAVNS
jgi:hypothetical protein